MIGVINYGFGNLRSVVNALTWIDSKVQIVERPEQIKGLGGLILPGVGAFIPAMKRLNQLDFTGPLQQWAKEEEKPLLGVCLGMQLLGSKGTEGGSFNGLGLINATIRRLVASDDARVPHMGWNRVKKTGRSCLWGELEQADCYFVHSYQMTFDELSEEKNVVVGMAEHGGSVVAMVETGNIMGTQFHPEKSQKDGLAMLRNFNAAIRAW